MNVNTANQQRTAQVQRVGDAQQGIINQSIADKANKVNDYTNPDGSVSPASFDELPDEDASNPNFQPSAREREASYLQAAAKTGDISPKDVASLDNRSDMASLRAETANNRNEMWKTVSDIKAQATVDAAQLRLDAANQRAANARSTRQQPHADHQ